MSVVAELFAPEAEIVCSVTDPKWLELRKTGIGSSDAAAILGKNPWKTPLDVYREKVSDQIDHKETMRMKIGRHLEDLVATEYENQYEVKLENPAVMYRSRRWPFALATPDRFLADGSAIVEIKVSNRDTEWGKEGSDEVPDAYLIQVQHQMAVTGVKEARIVVLLNMDSIREYVVKADPDLQKLIMQREAEFWTMVQNRQLPEQTDEEDPDQWIKLLDTLNPPGDNIIEMDDRLLELVKTNWALKQQRASIDRQIKKNNAEIIALMGDAKEAISEEGFRVVRTTVNRGRYVVQPSTYVTMRIYGPKAKENGSDEQQ